MKHGAFNMIPKANDKVCSGNSPLPHNPKIPHVDIKNEDNVDHLLQYQGYYILLINSTRPNGEPSLLCGNMEAVT
jgi:hypothetical protein